MCPRMAPPTGPFADSSVDPPVRGFLHVPASPVGPGLVLTHGAGGDCRGPMLVALAEACAGLGLTVLRCDLPYRQARATGPPRAGAAARDRAGLANAISALSRIAGERVCLGGQSYGGRQATMLAAERPDLVRALLLLSYPLHAPRRSGEPRTAHFPQLRTPALFVHGSRDPFGSLEEIRAALTLIPASTRLMEIEGAGHDLLGRGRAVVADRVREIAGAFAKLVETSG